MKSPNWIPACAMPDDFPACLGFMVRYRGQVYTRIVRGTLLVGWLVAEAAQ